MFPISFPVGKIRGSKASLTLETRTPFINLSDFCLVQFKLFGSVLIPAPLYKSVSTMFEVGIPTTVLFP